MGQGERVRRLFMGDDIQHILGVKQRLGTVLHLIGSVDPKIGGPVEALRQLYAVFKEHGIEIEAATLDQPDAPYLKDYPFKIYALGRPRGSEQWERTKIPWIRYRLSPKYTPWLRQNLHRYDLVIGHGIWTHSSSGAVGPLLKSKTPYFVFTHGALDPWFRQTYPIKHLIKQLFWWVGDGRYLHHAKSVLFTTEEERLLARGAFHGYSPAETVIRYGVADPPPHTEAQDLAFRARVPDLNGRPYLLYLSRIHPKKGCDLLIRAFAAKADKDPDLQLVIAGPDETGWQPDLSKLAERKGMGRRIHWPGMLRGDEKWGAFRNCEAFILPSHQENFGIVVAEALACGKQVLISDKVNIWREVTGSGGGLVAPDTLDGAKSLLARWLDQSPDERAAAATAARQCYLTYFDIKKTSVDIVRLVKQALPDGHS
jgi:glycosyltransferase involved in cell wall biosynthesis